MASQEETKGLKTAQPLTEFHYFPKLPFELRIEIYKQVYWQEPACVLLNLKHLSIYGLKGCEVALKQNRRSCPLLAVSHEARVEVQNIHRKWIEEVCLDGGRSFTFYPPTTTFLFTDEQIEVNGHPELRRKELSILFSQIQHVGFPTSSLWGRGCYTSDENSAIRRGLLSLFRSLKSITLIEHLDTKPFTSNQITQIQTYDPLGWYCQNRARNILASDYLLDFQDGPIKDVLKQQMKKLNGKIPELELVYNGNPFTRSLHKRFLKMMK